jgi:Ca-activated chloride channel family protein
VRGLKFKMTEYIRLTEPWIVGVGVIFIILFLFVYYFYLKKKKHLAKKLSSNSMIGSVVRKKSKKEFWMNLFLVFSVFFLFVALSDPHIRMNDEKEGISVVLVIDSSGSMIADDFSPNRMEAAKISAANFVDQMNLKDTIGVVSFSDSTRIVSFLRQDPDKIINSISTISASGRTAIGDGLAMGVDMVASIPNKKRLVILLSDGEQTAGQISIEDGIKYAQSEEVVVYTVGVGSSDEFVMGYDFFGRAQIAKLDEDSLKKIAGETGGAYFRARDNVALESIYENLPDQIKKEKELVSVKEETIILVILMLVGILVLKYWKRVKIW